MTQSLIPAIISAVAAIIAAGMGYRNHRSIGDVHVLVNNRLEEALAKIVELESKIKSDDAT
jgi:hypothetical protein